VNKQDLLDTGFFKNNNFLDKYVALFDEDYSNTDKLEGHYILPKSYYWIKKIPVDNSKDNLKNISYKNHYLACYYLLQCTTGILRKCMRYHFTKMNNKIAMVAFEINSQIYEQVRTNEKQNFSDYIKTAHHSIIYYNEKYKKRPSEHVRHMSESMKRYWKKKKEEERKNED
jgi:hypothetical protein